MVAAPLGPLVHTPAAQSPLAHSGALAQADPLVLPPLMGVEPLEPLEPFAPFDESSPSDEPPHAMTPIRQERSA